jgi:hypothetical protein
MSVLELASRGVRSAAVRLPRTVHNEGKGGFAGALTDTARRTGVSGYPGDGTQRWPAVHALDAAVLFRLVLEKAPAGTAWHAVADQGDAVRDIAAVIGRILELAVQAVPQQTFGPLGPIFATDQPPRAPTPDRHSAGSLDTRAFSKTWRTSSPDRRSRDRRTIRPGSCSTAPDVSGDRPATRPARRPGGLSQTTVCERRARLPGLDVPRAPWTPSLTSW